MSLHIGILQTGSVLPEFVEQYGDYPQMFTELFGGLDETLRFSTYDVQRAAPERVDCDAYVITGSKRSVYEDEAWIHGLVEYLRAVLAARRKIIGVCFGHQLIAHFFGGRVTEASAGWGVGVHRTRVLGARPWMAQAAPEMALLSSHKDQVVEAPDGAEVYLTSEFCPIAGFTLGDQVITVQGHPEFDKDYASALMHRRKDILGEQVFAAGIQSLAEPTREALMARWMLDFISA